MNPDLKKLLESNKAWAEQIKQEHPDFFKQLENQQKPEYLWIGCSDSRVPATEIVGMMPGEIFVHRNVANVVSHHDINAQAVIEFAVNVLKVKHIIVCGHYGCGGVQAALKGGTTGAVDNWLENIRQVHIQHKDEIDNIQAEPAKVSRLCELNVLTQVSNLKRLNVIKEALSRGQNLSIHGIIYSVSDGLLKELTTTS